MRSLYGPSDACAWAWRPGRRVNFFDFICSTELQKRNLLAWLLSYETARQNNVSQVVKSSVPLFICPAQKARRCGHSAIVSQPSDRWLIRWLHSPSPSLRLVHSAILLKSIQLFATCSTAISVYIIRLIKNVRASGGADRLQLYSNLDAIAHAYVLLADWRSWKSLFCLSLCNFSSVCVFFPHPWPTLFFFFKS